ncbi:MAG: choice-of-anchor Q domain-containing protein [Myxococcota bacterium]
MPGTRVLNNTFFNNRVSVGIYSSDASLVNNLIVDSDTPIVNEGRQYESQTNIITDDASLFVNAPADLRLKSDGSASAAIDKGTAMIDVTADFSGGDRPQGSGYDIGAYELGSTPPVVVNPPPVVSPRLCETQSEGDCWYFYVEAESQKMTDLQSTSSDDASGASYLDSAAADEAQVEFTINAPETRDYIIWARVLAPAATSDSFFVSANDGAEDVYDAAEGTWSNQWQWTRVNGRDGGAPLSLNPRIFSLDAGSNTVTFRVREAGVGIDVILVTNDVDFVPQGVPCAEGIIDGGKCTSGCTPQVEICDDGLDNDCDGDVDDVDANCQVPGCTPHDEVCDDGLDNDCDGAIDADDTNCQQGVCPENHIVVDPDGEQPDEFTVVVHDKDGNPVTCARVDVDLQALGCSGVSDETPLPLCLLSAGCLLVLGRRRKALRVARK